MAPNATWYKSLEKVMVEEVNEKERQEEKIAVAGCV
jgi:hypothetical protein